MIKDEDLKSRIDYSEGQKKAAHRVLVELVNIFREYDVSNPIEILRRYSYEKGIGIIFGINLYVVSSCL